MFILSVLKSPRTIILLENIAILTGCGMDVHRTPYIHVTVYKMELYFKQLRTGIELTKTIFALGM